MAVLWGTGQFLALSAATSPYTEVSLTSVGATPLIVAKGGTATLSCVAEDKDCQDGTIVNDGLSYSWTGLGSFSAQTNPTVWTANCPTGSQTLSVKVTDLATIADDTGAAGEKTGSVTVTVVELTSNHDEIWWFNGEDASNYYERATVTLHGPTSGSCSWMTYGPISEVSHSSLSITVESSGASASRSDAGVIAAYGAETFEISLTVLTPQLTEKPGNPTDIQEWEVAGQKIWQMKYFFYLDDQFGDPAPADIEANEVFGSYSPDQSNNWDHGVVNGSSPVTANAPETWDKYRKNYNLLENPDAVWPSEAGNTTRVFSKQQDYYLGSSVGGKGVLGESHNEQWRLGRVTQD